MWGSILETSFRCLELRVSTAGSFSDLGVLEEKEENNPTVIIYK